jgi:hypothetical protein
MKERILQDYYLFSKRVDVEGCSYICFLSKKFRFFW